MTSSNIERKRIKRATAVWVLYGPDGKSRDVILEQPEDGGLNWIGRWYSSEVLDSPGSCEMPRDGNAGKKAGYRVRRHRVSS